MSKAEWHTYVPDQRINDSGVLLDRGLVYYAVAGDGQHDEASLATTQVVRGLEFSNPSIQPKTGS